MVKSACLLVTHGSRDPRHHSAAEQLRLRVAQQWMSQAVPIVGLAALELTPRPLWEQILNFVDDLQSRGYDRLQIVPVFLLPGTHVMEDIPRQVLLAQQRLQRGFDLVLCPYLGSHPHWQTWLNVQIQSMPIDRWILFSHGSRRISSQSPLQQLSQALAVDLAYWSISPSLVEQVETLIERGYSRIGIFPFILFPGGILDALQITSQQILNQYPHLSLTVLPALDARPELASLIVDLI